MVLFKGNCIHISSFYLTCYFIAVFTETYVSEETIINYNPFLLSNDIITLFFMGKINKYLFSNIKKGIFKDGSIKKAIFSYIKKAKFT